MNELKKKKNNKKYLFGFGLIFIILSILVVFIIKQNYKQEKDKEVPYQQPSGNYITYDKPNYTCQVGEVFDAMISAGGLSSIVNFNSSNPSIAIIESGTIEGNETNCLNCKAVHITCKNRGEVTLSATSSTGATTEVTLNVK